MSTNNSKQVFWVSVGSLAAFGFSIASSFVLSRYIDKSEYGTYKQVMYVYHTLLTVFTLGIPKSFSFFIPRVPEAQVRGLIKKLLKLLFLFGSLFSLVLLLGAVPISRLLSNEDLVVALQIFSPVPLLLLPTMALDGILASFKKATYLAIYNIVTNIVKLLFVIVPVVFFQSNIEIALGGFVLSSAISLIYAFSIINKTTAGTQEESCVTSYKEIFAFSIPLVTASVWGILISSADQFFISRYFGNVVFAEFSNGSIDLPFIGMISSACAVVLSPQFSKISSEGIGARDKLLNLWRSVFEKVIILLYPLILFCIFFPESIMSVLYGEQYECSAFYFVCRLITNFFSVIAYGPFIINIGKVKDFSRVHMFIAFVIIICEFISVQTIHSSYAISIISMICVIGKTICFQKVISKTLEMPLTKLIPIKLIVKIIVPCILYLTIIRLIMSQYMELKGLYLILVGFPVYYILVVLLLYLLKINIINIIKPLFHRK